MNTCAWPLGNGSSLDFDVYPENTKWNKAAGLYIFSYQDGQYWRALYVGQTDDFSSRIPSHERFAEAGRKGATHIHALVVPLADNRDRWEEMLIRNLQPPMNAQFRKGQSGG
jgi:hypothetical protein